MLFLYLEPKHFKNSVGVEDTPLPEIGGWLITHTNTIVKKLIGTIQRGSASSQKHNSRPHLRC